LQPPRRRLRVLVTALVTLATVAAGAPGLSSPEVGLHGWHGIQGEGEGRVESLDRRRATVAPTAEQERIARELGATAVRWNRFGTPHVVVNHGGYLSEPADGPAAEVARAFVDEHRQLFRLSSAQVRDLELLRDSPLHDAPDLARLRDGGEAADPDVAHVVLFRQRFGGLHAGWDGLLTVAVQDDGRIAWLSSSVTADDTVEGAFRLSPLEAVVVAAADVDFELGELAAEAPDGPWQAFSSDVAGDLQRVRPVAFPTVERRLRAAYEVTLLKSTHDEHGHPEAYIMFVDAEDGTVWFRDNRVDHLQDDDEPIATWRVFPANPPFVIGEGAADDPGADTRVLWCWGSSAGVCSGDVSNAAARIAWDVNPPSLPAFTTDGNNATTAISEASPFTPDTLFHRPVSPTRTYDFSWDNTWFDAACDPAVFATGNDDDAATANLFVMHNRMHDWSYYLGFTERNHNMQKSNFGDHDHARGNDPEVGQAQAGRLTVLGRDNANQITLQDGIAPITNQYLWEPLAGAFYAPCVDGAYDMAIVAHEYTHAISNRMIAGPDTGTGRSQGQTESWSDLAFAEYFRGFGIVASPDANPYALAPYVTGDLEAGIRNYGMNRSPLTYADLGYDGSGLTSPHANGEIWSAVNFDISVALNETYDAEYPSSDAELQRQCAEGQLAADECPGNRRWAQLMFDGFLLNPTNSSMVDSRDAMLAADVLRFHGANQFDLWEMFARRGLGAAASSVGVDDQDPQPGWSNPLRDDNASVTFELVDEDGDPVVGEVYAGVYEARVTPTADTDPVTATDEVEEFTPGTYTLLARADGFGAARTTATFDAGESPVVSFTLRRNHASGHNGATISGDGVNLGELIDDTEATNWASLTGEGTASDGKPEGAQVEGRQVTVTLADGPQLVGEVQVSAALRGAREDDGEPDPGNQNRFSALRSFEIWTCDASAGLDCGTDASFTRIFRSEPDAFDGRRPRPRVPDLTLRSFDVPDTVATHVRLVVVDNQCTGGPDFQGDVNPVADPVFSNPDCDSEAGSLGRTILLDPPQDQVRAAELQVFSPLAGGDRHDRGRRDEDARDRRGEDGRDRRDEGRDRQDRRRPNRP
jgi:extracellular elastinolytic metalloproteinase